MRTAVIKPTKGIWHRRSDSLAVARAEGDINQWKKWLRSISSGTNAPIAIFKTALKAQGIIDDDRMCEPLVGLTDAERVRVIEADSRMPRD